MKNKVVKQIGDVLVKNSPTILTGLSVAGLISTTVMAVRATPKALLIIEEEQRRNYNENYGGQRLTRREVVRATWKCYIPAAIMGGVTIGCIIGANSISLKRNAALASVYSITEATLKEYQNKVVEVIGENKARQIKDEIAKDRIEKDPVTNKEVIITGKGETLCYDSLSGRYFKNDIENIRKVLNKVSRDLISDMTVTLNDIYYELGLSSTKLGDSIGWHVDDGLIEAEFSSQLADDGTPCLVLDFSVEPRYMDFN